MSRKKNKKNAASSGSVAVAEKPSEPQHKETPAEFVASILSTLIIALYIITFVLQPFKIPSASMEKTLLIGDHLFVDRISLSPATKWMPLHYSDVHRGDIIVFYSPAQPDLHLVKRVIGVPGDRIHLKDGVLYRNGERVPDKYVFTDIDDKHPYDRYAANFPSVPPSEAMYSLYPPWLESLQSHIENGEIVVPKDHYFAMGDHRNVSLDSRYWGFVPRENIIGRPLFVWWSFNDPDPSILTEIIHFFDKTRWSRTFYRAR